MSQQGTDQHKTDRDDTQQQYLQVWAEIDKRVSFAKESPDPGFNPLTASDQDPTGFAFLTLRPTPYYDGPLAQLEELYVRPELRDQGQGTALLQTAMRLVRERGGGEIHINVDEVDTDTRRFYERHGFVNIEPGADYRMLCYIREL